MKKKVLAKNRTDLADLLNKLDGLRTGFSRKDIRGALKLLETLEIAVIKSGKYRSPSLMIRARARKKAK
jgi:uncharacterized protein Smg (DUF494 family)